MENRSIAFVGLGRMGAPMAARLAAAGHRLRAYDQSPQALARFAKAHRATACTSPADAARGAGVLVTMLPDGRAVRAALFGRSGAAGSLARRSVVLDMSSCDPAGTRALGVELAAAGIAFIDAPVSGRVEGAREGTLTIMAGGRAATLARVRPLLEVMGRRIFHAGPLGAGHAVKALNNTIAAAGTLAAFEAIIVGRAFGLDPVRMTEIFNASAGRNSTTENKIRQYVLSGAYASGFALSLMAKDVGIAAALARSLGVDAPLSRGTARIWRAAQRRLGVAADHTEVYRYLAALKRGKKAKGGVGHG